MRATLGNAMKPSPRFVRLSCGIALVTVALGCGEPGGSVFSGAGGSSGAAGAAGALGAGGGSEASGGGGEPGGQGGSGGGGYRGPNTVISNTDPSCYWVPYLASDGQENHLAAARLTPPSYPFVIAFVRYTLLSDMDYCDNRLGHGVDVFVGSAVAPAASPAVIEHFDVPMNDDFQLEKVMLHELSAPLTLEQGEHVFVAVRMTANVPLSRLCVLSCGGPAFQQDRNYWSNAVAPPYPWTMVSPDGGRNFAFEAIGHPP
jgi:hypothetical protein